MATHKIPRGIRNNNPLNIEFKKNTRWLGLAPMPTDGRFAVFTDMIYGVRAAFKILRTYMAEPPRGHGLTTITAIISRWAPASENATENYIRIVSSRSGISPCETLTFAQKDKICRLLQNMCFVETGKIIDMKIIHEAYDLSAI